MKRLELKQIEVEMNYGTIRLLINRYNSDGEKGTPELVTLAAHTDVGLHLANVRANLTEREGYPWLADDVLARAMQHRELVLSDPTVILNNERLRKQREAEEAAQEEHR